MNVLTPSTALVHSLYLLQTKLTKKLDNHLSLHGISFTEFLVMYHLSLAIEMTMRRIELAESIGITASGVTRLLLPMQKNRLVIKQRNPRDARESHVKLAQAGEEILRDALITFEQASSELTQTLDVKQMLKLTEKIL